MPNASPMCNIYDRPYFSRHVSGNSGGFFPKHSQEHNLM